MPHPTTRVYFIDNGGEHEVWLDAGLDLNVRLCLGVGDSKEEATDDAIGELRAALRQLGAPITDVRDLE